jgi:hypothetical protein
MHAVARDLRMDSDLHWKSKILQSKYGMLGQGHRDGIVFVLLPPSQLIRHSKNLGESKDLKFDQIYMIK